MVYYLKKELDDTEEPDLKPNKEKKQILYDICNNIMSCFDRTSNGDNENITKNNNIFQSLNIIKSKSIQQQKKKYLHFNRERIINKINYNQEYDTFSMKQQPLLGISNNYNNIIININNWITNIFFLFIE